MHGVCACDGREGELQCIAASEQAARAMASLLCTFLMMSSRRFPERAHAHVAVAVQLVVEAVLPALKEPVHGKGPHEGFHHR